MAEVLKGSVGLAVKGGPKVKNDPDDVVLVRKILRANGYNVKPTGNYDVGIAKALSQAAVKAKLESKVGVIVPNGDLMKALKPKYIAWLKKGGDEAEGDAGKGKGEKKVNVYHITYKGSKPKVVDEATYKAVNAKIFKSLEKYVKSLTSASAENQKTIDGYIRAAAGQEGAIKAFTHIFATSARLSPVRYPNQSLADRAYNASKALAKAHSSGDIKRLNEALPVAEIAINASITDVQRFLKEFTGAAGQAAVGVGLASGVAFAIVGAMATPVLVTAGLTETAAAAASLVSVKVLESAATDLGRVASSEKVTILEAIGNATVNSVIALITMGVGNKLGGKYVDDLSKSMAGKLASKFGVNAGKLEGFIKHAVNVPRVEGMKSAVEETLGLVKLRMKSGKPLKASDLEGAFTKVMISTLMSPLATKLGDAADGAKKELSDALGGKIVLDSARKILKEARKDGLDKKLEQALVVSMRTKLAEELSKNALTMGIENCKATDTPAKIAKTGVDMVMNDRKTQATIEKELRAEMKKRKMI